MYNVWDKNASMPLAADIKRLNCKTVTIKPFEPENDGYIFLHGVAIAHFKGKMYCAWAHNKVQENSDDEEVNFAVSTDGGLTWSGMILGDFKSDPSFGAISHGAFLVHNGALYFYAPRFLGQLGAKMMQMHAYVLDEKRGNFRHLGVALDDRFWPMCTPVLMENGNYVMAGIYVGESYTSQDNTAAVAISHGSDVLSFDMVRLDKANVSVWGECTVTVNRNVCNLYCREHSGRKIALFSQSTDYGKTWLKLDQSDLPMTDSKPYAGTLSDGRSYLICSCAGDLHSLPLRDPLTIILTEKGCDTFSKIYTIDSGSILSYPYATEHDGKLYVAYSQMPHNADRFNVNAAMLAIIDLKEL